MTTNTNLTITANELTTPTLDKCALALAIMSNTPEICGAYYKDLPLALLEPHPTIQRKLVPDHYGRIAADWDISKCAPLTVSLQDDGTFYIIDGQHRYMAAKTLGIPTIPCRIFRNLTPEEEAAAFWKQNENCKRLTPRDTLRARLTIHEPIAESLAKLCREHGICLFRESSLDKPWLRALCDVEMILRTEGEYAVDEIFDFIEISGWQDETLGYSKDVIRSAYRFYRLFKNADYFNLRFLGNYVQRFTKEHGMSLDDCLAFSRTCCIGKTRESCLFNFYRDLVGNGYDLEKELERMKKKNAKRSVNA